METKQLIENITEHYGIMHELKWFNSEVFELNEAIFEYENFNDYRPKEASSIEVNEDFFTIPEYAEHLKEHIAEEIADCLLFLKQFQYYYKIENEEIEKVLKYKVERTNERIKNGYYDKK